MEFSNSAGHSIAPRKSVTRLVLGLFSSVWTGIAIASTLFVYCAIGSAMPTVRQHRLLEMTEFEWFHWWPFKALIVLLCTTMVVVTLRRIPLRLVNAGVWTIHTGIIVLCLGSYRYFSTKVEGDAPVFRRQVRIDMPGMDRPETLVALPGNGTSVTVGPDIWRFQIQSTNSEWPILSAGHEGEKTYSVNVMVTPPGKDPFIRQLLAGYPEYTEDIIPGKGRAVKSIGRKLVNESLGLTLEYEPQNYFYLIQSWALYIRRIGEAEWVERPIRGMPRYHDRIGSRELVHNDPQYRVPLHALDLPVEPAAGGDAIGSGSVRITGFLRYAHLQREWRDGGAQLNPVSRVTLFSDHARPQSHELIAFDRTRNHSEDGMVQFRWLRDSRDVASLETTSGAMLSVSVPGSEVNLEVPMTNENVVGGDGPFTKIEGTTYSYRIRNLQDDLVIPRTGTIVSVAMVEIEFPEGRVTRMVADQPGMTRDMQGGASDPHASSPNTPKATDARIVMTYRPQSAPIILAAYPGGMHLVVNGPASRLISRDIAVAEVVEVIPGLRVRVDGFWAAAVSELKPRIVQPSARRRDAGEMFSMVRVEVQSGSKIETKWLQFNQYAFPGDQYAYAGRFSYLPERFQLDDGTGIEIMFSRRRLALPSPVALDDFVLDTHVGGFTGQALTILNYESTLRFLDDGKWTQPVSIMVNAPTEHRGYWYFQSMWDKPPVNNPTGGMNYTGLGVGNRNGVYVQLAGCCLAVSGMIFAFYVKPMIKRRRAERSRAKVGDASDANHGDAEATAREMAEAVRV